MDQISKVVEISINTGMVAEFKEVATRFIERVNASEPDTLSYEWFLDTEGSKCYILEKYRDSETLLAHLENVRDLYEPILALSKITRIEVFGDASEEVKEAHIPGTKFFQYWSGFTRL